ncbi:MAG: cobyric acid synthase [Candidatus Methylomirabilota bacterium]|nr:MAG: cobyric acid synthase [candidate division NC10 bacterium]
MGRRAQAIAVLGTGSDVGKSVIVAGLCRLLHRAGVRVAPFKAQNMSLNSFVTVEGGEMGRAQVLQAYACGLVPHVDMNPILLKPEADDRSQVILYGKVLGSHDAGGYFTRTRELFRFVRASYERLASQYEVIVVEGAGSAAEMNLRDRDLVNWPVAELADAGVVLVADIDRGGVFAQVIGTLDLLSADERERLVGVIVNKFRGDTRLFADGVAFLEARTDLPVLGVLPFLRDLELDQEDSVEVERYRHTRFTSQGVNVAVTLLPRMSNFTDFNALAAEGDVALRYAASPRDIQGADVVVLPGSKNTIADLEHLRRAGFDEALMAHVDRGGELVGICGGYQMLGRVIADPHGVEAGGRMQGLGLLDVITELRPHKRTVQIEALALHVEALPDSIVSGYEIHMGVTRRETAMPCFRILRRIGQAGPGGDPAWQEEQEALDGAIRQDRLVWGTYIHGLFDRPGFRRLWLNRLRERKGLPQLDTVVSEAVAARLASALDCWADHMAQHVDVGRIFAAVGVGKALERG